MKASPSRRPLVLGVHPIDRGFGWVILASPLAPIDWGVVEHKKDKNARCLLRIEKIVERYHPAVVVLEAFEHGAAQKADRVQRLCRAIVQLANNRGIETSVYSRAAIRTCFISVGAATRHEIATVIAQHITAFRHRLPKARKSYTSEHPNLALFSATAVALAHFAVTERKSQ